MSKKQDTKTTTPLLSAATILDEQFTELTKIATSLGRQDLQTDKGFERARMLLDRFHTNRSNLGQAMSELSSELDFARQRFDEETASVSEIADKVLDRHREIEGYIERFRDIGTKVAAINEAASQYSHQQKEPREGEAPQETPIDIQSLLSAIDELVEEAQTLKQDAKDASLKTMENTIDALRQKLHSAGNRLSQMASDSAVQH